VALVLFWLTKEQDTKDATPISSESVPIDQPLSSAEVMTFAVIGDFGDAGHAVQQVAGMVRSWEPAFIITTGDNNYPDGEAETIEENVGQYFQAYIEGDETRFFPSLGNHDWRPQSVRTYTEYFPISESNANTNSSGNERYYDFVQGPVHFFALDSNGEEPDGNTADSRQADWLQAQLAASTTPWQIVYFHHSPYSSGLHGSDTDMQWPFKAWGADIVLTGHDHHYERLMVDGFPYIVNGLGGAEIRDFEATLPVSLFQFNDDYGAMLVQVTAERLTLEFYSIQDWQQPIDQLTLFLN
jgi:hypothetical protein